MKITTAVALFFVAYGIVAAVHEHTSTAYWQVLFLLLIILSRPLITFITAKRSYAENRIGVETTFDFDSEYFSIKTQFFSTQISWEKIYKVTQTTNWIMIWQNAQVANPIPKSDMFESDSIELKRILNRNNVKNNL